MFKSLELLKHISGRALHQEMTASRPLIRLQNYALNLGLEPKQELPVNKRSATLVAFRTSADLSSSR
jgi:hypothetical protein